MNTLQRSKAVGSIEFRGIFSDSTTARSGTGRRQDEPNIGAGSWAVPNPSGFNGGVNLYEAIGNDATNATDPSGLAAISNHGKVKTIVGDGYDPKVGAMYKLVAGAHTQNWGVIPDEKRFNNSPSPDGSKTRNFETFQVNFTKTASLAVVLTAADTNGTSETWFDMQIYNYTNDLWKSITIQLGYIDRAGKFAPIPNGSKLAFDIQARKKPGSLKYNGYQVIQPSPGTTNAKNFDFLGPSPKSVPMAL